MLKAAAGPFAACAASAALVLVMFIDAPAATADPEILEPYCTSGQVPTTDACRPVPDEVYTNDAPGADPDVPVGLDPETVPDV